MATLNLPKVAASAWVCSSTTFSASASNSLTPGDARPSSSRWSSRRSAVPLETLIPFSPSFIKLQKDDLHYPSESWRNFGSSGFRRKQGGSTDKVTTVWKPKEAVLTGIEDTGAGGALFKFGHMEQLLALDKLLTFLREGDPGLDHWMARASSNNNLVALFYEMLGVDTLVGQLRLSDSLPSYLKYDQMDFNFGKVNTEEMVSHILASMTSTSKMKIPIYDEASLVTNFDSISDSDWWRTFDGIFGLGDEYGVQTENISFSGYERDSAVVREELELSKELDMADGSAFRFLEPGSAKELRDLSAESLQQDLDRRCSELTADLDMQSSLRFPELVTDMPSAVRRLEKSLYVETEASAMEYTRLDFVRNESLPLPWLEEKVAEETRGFLWLTREADISTEVLELERHVEVSVATASVTAEIVETPHVAQAVAHMEASSSMATEEHTETKKVKTPKNAPKDSKKQRAKSKSSTKASSSRKAAAHSRTRSEDSLDFMSSYHSNSVSSALGLIGMRQDYAAELARGLNQIAVVLAGGGLACILQVASRMLGINPAFDFGKVVVLVRGCGFIWMSAAVQKLQRVLFAIPQVCAQSEKEQVMRVATELRLLSLKAFSFVILSIIVGGL